MAQQREKGIRAFIGIFPPQQILTEIEQIQSLLKADEAGVKWELPEKFHVTMRFLGNTSQTNLNRLQLLLCEKLINLHSFELSVSTIGCFPSPKNPRVFWMGPRDEDDTSSVKSCSKLIDEACIEAGLTKEERPFHPHITIGRTKGNVFPRLITIMESATFQPLTFRCHQISVMRSSLHASGSSYSTLFIIPLKQ